MTIYLIPYQQTEVANIVEIYGLDPQFYNNEIIGDSPLEYGSIYAAESIDVICEIKNMANSATSSINEMLVEFQLTDAIFEFTPEQIECGLFVPKNLINEIPANLLENEHRIIFPKLEMLKIQNGIFEIIN